MKAIRYHAYGTPDQLTLEEVDKPIASANEVLIRVRAASLNSWDWDLLRGTPWIVRIGGWSKPRFSILGCDVAGVVEATGENVKRFKPGDEVFGDLSGYRWGGFAEYVCADEKWLALKPATMAFTTAAALPQAGVLALQGLDRGELREGQHLLINGGGGGVGTIAIQLARLRGATVTVVDLPTKHEVMMQLGASNLIDYTQTDFTRSGQRYDVILDVTAQHLPRDYRRAMHANSAYVMVGGRMKSIFRIMLAGLFNKNFRILAHKPSVTDLIRLADFVEKEGLRVIIDRTFSLHETADAFRYFGTGNVIGKVVITVP